MSSNKDRGLEASLGDQNTFRGQAKPKIESRDTKSLGDQVTFGGAGVVGDFDDEGMEVVDLAVRYKFEKTLGTISDRG